MLEIDLEVWAPLGADERIRQLWRATPDANPLPDGVEPRDPPGAPAKERLGELAVPTLVVTASHDPAGFREIGPLVAREAPDARHVELDSDHYVTLREPELLVRRAARVPGRGGAAGVGLAAASSATRAADRRADPGPREAAADSAPRSRQLPTATFSQGRPLRQCTASVRSPLRSESTML